MVVLQGQVKRMSAILLLPKWEDTTWEEARNWKAIVHLYSHEVFSWRERGIHKHPGLTGPGRLHARQREKQGHVPWPTLCMEKAGFY